MRVIRVIAVIHTYTSMFTLVVGVVGLIFAPLLPTSVGDAALVVVTSLLVFAISVFVGALADEELVRSRTRQRA